MAACRAPGPTSAATTGPDGVPASPRSPIRDDVALVAVPGVDDAGAAVTVGGFSECGGLESSFEVQEYQEGGVNDQARSLLSRVDGAADDLARDLTNSEAKPDELTQEDAAVESSEHQLATTLASIREALGLTDEVNPEQVKQDVTADVGQLDTSKNH
jgi:hypothetical protein